MSFTATLRLISSLQLDLCPEDVMQSLQFQSITLSCFTIMTGLNQTPVWFMTIMTVYMTSGLIEMSYSPSVDSTLFVRIRSFDGYLHKTYNLTSLTPVRSRIDCSRVCMQNPECGSFFYLDKPKKLCQTHSVLFVTTNEAVVAPSASYYQLTQAVCPHEKGYILYRAAPLCYNYFTTPVSWTGAKQNCQAIPGHLVDVKTPDVSNHLVSFLTASSTLRGSHVSAGGSLNGSSWYWSDRTQIKWTNWAANEPSGPNENCLSLAFFFQFKWNDVPCDGYPKPYLCQVDI